MALVLTTSSLLCFAEPESPPSVSPAQTGKPPFALQPVPGWGALPSDVSFGPTHGGIAVDQAGNLDVSTDNAAGIFVFGREGRLLRTMAPGFAGTHSLLIREESGTEYLYGVHLRKTRVFKLTLDGNPVLILPRPKAPGLYAAAGAGYLPTLKKVLTSRATGMRMSFI